MELLLRVYISKGKLQTRPFIIILKSFILVEDMQWRLKEGHAYCEAETQWGEQNHLTSALSKMLQITKETDFALKSHPHTASDSKKFILLISGCVKLSNFSNTI